MSNDWYDDETVKKHIRNIAEKVITDYQRELPQHIAGNKFRVPPRMREWMDGETSVRGGVDTYYVVNVGYGHNALSLHFTFREDDITMEFRDPYGTRLFILELIKLCQKPSSRYQPNIAMRYSAGVKHVMNILSLLTGGET